MEIWESDARSSFCVNSTSNPARTGRCGSRRCVRDSHGIDGGSHRRESYAAGSGVARSSTEELPPLGTAAQDPATLYAGVVSTSGIRSGLSSVAALALWLRGSQAPISDRTSRRERFRYAPAVCGTDGACHLGGVWEHRSSPFIADRFSDRLAPADTIPPCANSPRSLTSLSFDSLGCSSSKDCCHSPP